MTNSITVEFLDNDKNVSEVKQFKSIKELQKEYPQYAYQQLRQIYLFTMNKTTTKNLKKNANIFNQLKIYDTDKYVQKVAI